MRTLFPLLVGVVLAGFSGLAAQAAPAPFYKWQSKLDGQVACMQTSPGDGWVLERSWRLQGQRETVHSRLGRPLSLLLRARPRE